ncbi:MAG: hypothetical protein U0903_08625 [Planctomycetales bacterium]
MSILVDKETKVICQGITGKVGLFHSQKCREYGTPMVGGVTPGKGGTEIDGFPVFNSVEESIRKTGANTMMIFVLPFCADAILEAADAGIKLIIAITEGVPVLTHAWPKSRKGKSRRLVGPNCPGVITPGVAKIGIMPGYIHKPGPVGLMSRSGERQDLRSGVAIEQPGTGQSTCVGLGGDPIVGTSFT